MINFSRSSFMWKAHPWKPDPHYKWPGGFVGEHGQGLSRAFYLRGALRFCATAMGPSWRNSFWAHPCRSEYTIASENLFQISQR